MVSAAPLKKQNLAKKSSLDQVCNKPPLGPMGKGVLLSSASSKPTLTRQQQQQQIIHLSKAHSSLSSHSSSSNNHHQSTSTMTAAFAGIPDSLSAALETERDLKAAFLSCKIVSTAGSVPRVSLDTSASASVFSTITTAAAADSVSTLPLQTPTTPTQIPHILPPPPPPPSPSKSILKKSSCTSLASQQSISSLTSSSTSTTSTTTTSTTSKPRKKLSFHPSSLESILHFTATDPPSSTTSPIITLADLVSLSAKSVSSALLIPAFWSISSHNHNNNNNNNLFTNNRESNKNNVWLHSLSLPPHSNSLHFSIMVRNLIYEKQVVVRYTLTAWKPSLANKFGFTDRSATFLHSSSLLDDGGGVGVDRFVLVLDLDGDDEDGDGGGILGGGGQEWAELEFAVLFKAMGHPDYWDNNNSQNYKVSLTRASLMTALGRERLKVAEDPFVESAAYLRTGSSNKYSSSFANNTTASTTSTTTSTTFYSSHPPPPYLQHRQHAHPFPVHTNTSFLSKNFADTTRSVSVGRGGSNKKRTTSTTRSSTSSTPATSVYEQSKHLFQNFYSILPSSTSSTY